MSELLQGRGNLINLVAVDWVDLCPGCLDFGCLCFGYLSFGWLGLGCLGFGWEPRRTTYHFGLLAWGAKLLKEGTLLWCQNLVQSLLVQSHFKTKKKMVMLMQNHSTLWNLSSKLIRQILAKKLETTFLLFWNSLKYPTKESNLKTIRKAIN